MMLLHGQQWEDRNEEYLKIVEVQNSEKLARHIEA